MKHVAIIGTGIAGMASANLLHREFAVTLYEKNNYVGGHTNTVVIDEEGTPVPIDTGFMVYNEVTYPQLTRLFNELKVPTKPAPMSFSVQHRPSGLEFCGSGFGGLFAQRKNIFRPKFWRLLREIHRFNRESLEVLNDSRWDLYSLRQYTTERRYRDDFLERYLIPMSSAVWSTPPDRMMEFPAATLIRFFHNHGFLGLHTQHPWRTVAGGSVVYRNKLTQNFRDQIQTNRAVVGITRRDGKVDVTDRSGACVTFDAVIVASHADQSLALLNDATALERQLLGAFKYQRNRATLHSDDRTMPKNKAAWSSWNYRLDLDKSGAKQASTTYYMNSLQGVSKKRDYFVSINDPGSIRPETVHRVMDYEHPLFTVDSAVAQRELPTLNRTGPVYFCGSYFRNGFHEDALVSAIDAVQALRAAR